MDAPNFYIPRMSGGGGGDPWAGAANAYGNELDRLQGLQQQGYQQIAQAPLNLFDRFQKGYLQAQEAARQQQLQDRADAQLERQNRLADNTLAHTQAQDAAAQQRLVQGDRVSMANDINAITDDLTKNADGTNMGMYESRLVNTYLARNPKATPQDAKDWAQQFIPKGTSVVTPGKDIAGIDALPADMAAGLKTGKIGKAAPLPGDATMDASSVPSWDIAAPEGGAVTVPGADPTDAALNSPDAGKGWGFQTPDIQTDAPYKGTLVRQAEALAAKVAEDQSRQRDELRRKEERDQNNVDATNRRLDIMAARPTNINIQALPNSTDFRQELPPILEQKAIMVRDKKLPPQIRSRGNPDADLVNARANYLAQEAEMDGVDASGYKRMDKSKSSFAAGSPLGKQLQSLDTTIQHFDQLGEATKALQNGDFRRANQLANTLGFELGGSAQNNQQIIAQFASKELDRLVSAGVGTQAERDALLKPFSGSNSPQQSQDATKTAIKLMGGRVSAIENQYRLAYGDDADFAGQLMPQTVNVLRNNGYQFRGGASGGGGGGGSSFKYTDPNGVTKDLNDTPANRAWAKNGGRF